MTPVLSVENLSISFTQEGRSVTVVNGVSYHINPGEVVALVGESGSGKSVTALSSMKLLGNSAQISGKTHYNGQDISEHDEGALRKLRGNEVSFIFQEPMISLNPLHTIEKQLRESLELHQGVTGAAARVQILQLLERVGIQDAETRLSDYPHQLSGGQLQRAMTAMAMSCRPDLIIFDEPTTALDVTTQIEVLSAIRDIVKQFSTAAIYITHDLAVVAQMADRIKVLLRGDEVEENTTRAMLKSPRESYTKSLWAVRSFERKQKPPAKTGAIPVISLKNVTAAYAKNDPVVRDVSFDIHAGRTVAVVGESGSGKSTAARCITGLLPPLTGSISFDGTALQPDYRQRSNEQLRQMQMIYQMADTALNPRKKIGEIIGRPVEFYLGLTGREKRRRVEELLAQIELEPTEFIDRYPAEISGGQKQRIGIARALAAEPKFIICDEVTSALDQLVAEGILRLLTDLQDKMQLSFMLITHDLSTVRAIADEVV
ncbi:MAG: ABC transporter ATP-binding protein, partial [Rhodobacteraceae bacterium]|nr:ABC transporter ATP-binding protein [Paracoccaceae bacterium]